MSHGLAWALCLTSVVPGVAAQTANFQDPPGDVELDGAPYPGPGAALVDMLGVSLAASESFLNVTMHVASLDDANLHATPGNDIMHIVDFTLHNRSGDFARGVRVDHCYLCQPIMDILRGEVLWDFKFLVEPLGLKEIPINGTVDLAANTLAFHVPIGLLGGEPLGLTNLAATAQYHTRTTIGWSDFVQAPGLTLNLSTQSTNPDPSSSPSPSTEAHGTPSASWPFAAAAWLLAVGLRRR